MAVQFRRGVSPGEDIQEPVWADWSTFTDIFREYAEYIFEYCISLLSDEHEAAAATTVTFVTAQPLLGYLENHDRLEAWLFALARRECTSKRPARWEKLPNGTGLGPRATGRAPLRKAVTASAPAGNGQAEGTTAVNGQAEGTTAVNGQVEGVAGGSGGAGDLTVPFNGILPINSILPVNGTVSVNGAGPVNGTAEVNGAGLLNGADLPRAEAADGETDELSAITRTNERRIAGRQALSAFSRLPEEDREVLAAFSALSPRDREVLDLVYWHGLSPVELPAILDIPPQRAQTLLASAVRRFRLAAENVQPDEPGDDAERSGDKLAAAMPVASMPAAVWRRASRAVFDPELRSYRNAVVAHVGRLRPDGFPAQPAAPGARAQTVKVGVAILVPAAAGLALLAYVVGSSSGAPAGAIALTTPDAPSTAAGTHQAAAAAGSRHGHAKARHGALPISSLFPGHSTQGILPVPSPGTSSYTPAPNPSTASSAPSSQPSSIAPPPSHKASPTPTTKPTPTPTLSGPSPTPTPTPTSSATSSSAATSSSPAAIDSPASSALPSAQIAISVASERLVPSGMIDRYLI